MRRSWAALASVWLAATALVLQAAVVPSVALACTCTWPPPSLKEVVADEPQVTIIVGTVARLQEQVTPVVVNAWFHGPRATDLVWLNGGTQVMTSCDVVLTPGEQRLLVLHGDGSEPYWQNMCWPGGTVDSDEGRALLAEAEALFGPAQAPPTPQPKSVPPLEISGEPQIWAWLLGAAGAAATLLAGIAIFARWRRSLS